MSSVDRHQEHRAIEALWKEMGRLGEGIAL